MRKIRFFSLMLVLMCLVGCSFGGEKLGLSEDMTQAIENDIEQIMSEAMAPRVEPDEFTFVFTKDEAEGPEDRYKVEVTSTWTTIREPAQDPMIVGMYQAKEALGTKAEKEDAQKIIDGFLAEMSPVGTEEKLTYYITVVCDSEGQYDLRYSYTDEGAQYEEPLEEYFVKEDEAERKQLGIDTLKQFMGESQTVRTDYYSLIMHQGWDAVETGNTLELLAAEETVAVISVSENFKYGASTSSIVKNQLGMHADIQSERTVETGDKNLTFQCVEVAFWRSAAMIANGEPAWPNEIHYYAVVGDLFIDIKLQDEAMMNDVETVIGTMKLAE